MKILKILKDFETSAYILAAKYVRYFMNKGRQKIVYTRAAILIGSSTACQIIPEFDESFCRLFDGMIETKQRKERLFFNVKPI